MTDLKEQHRQQHIKSLDSLLHNRKCLALAVVSLMLNCHTSRTPYSAQIQALLDAVYSETDSIKKELDELKSATRPERT